MSIIRTCFSALLLLLASSAFAQNGFDIKTVDPETFRAIAFKITDAQRPDIDGKLTDEAWALAPAQGNFVQREPNYGAPASEKTEFRVLYDDKSIYIGVWVWDREPSGIMGSEMKRDAGLNKGDQLKITIDTFHDHRNAFYFSTNPLGAYKDANTIENGRTINYDWNAVWNNKTTIDDQGWYIEIEIPLSQLRFRTTIGESTWGLNLCRILFRKNEEAYWVPFPREWGANGFARVSNAGVLEGLKDLKARRRIEFVPFLSPTASRDYVTAAKFDTDAKFGGDFKIGLTNDLIADFTYHTDFAQVEADQEVVNLTRFSLFFPEKRQFFTETAGIFDFGKSVSAGLGGEAAANDPGLLNLFYSRRIGLVDGQQVPIIGGGRLTGRIGDYAIGVMNIATQEESLAARELDNANFTVVRLKRNVLRSSNIGALVVNSADGISDYNRAIGIDGGFVLGPRVTRDDRAGKNVLAWTASGKDLAGVVDFQWKSDRFNYGGQYLDVGERFNAEMGYIPRLDVRATQRPSGMDAAAAAGGGIRQMTFDGNADYYENHAGIVDSRTAGRCRRRCNGRTRRARLHRHRSREFDNLAAAVRDGRHDDSGRQLFVDVCDDRATHRIAPGGLSDDRRRRRRLLQRRSPELAREPDAPGRQDPAVRAAVRAQSRDAGRTAALHQQRPQLPRQPFVLAGLLPEGLCPVQRRSQVGELQLPVVVSLQAGQRLVCRLQPGLGHRSAADVTRAA